MLGFDTTLERARKREQDALMRLYDLSCNAVFNASYRIVLNEQDAEEITQDAILKAFENLNSFKGSEREFVALVKTIAINKSIDMFRRRRKDPFYVEIDNTADQIEDEDDDFEDFPIEKIKETLNNLPDGYRLTITLRLIDGMEFADIAEKMGINHRNFTATITAIKKMLVYILLLSAMLSFWLFLQPKRALQVSMWATYILCSLRYDFGNYIHYKWIFVTVQRLGLKEIHRQGT